ncbi:outer membrane protein [Marinobacter sp. MBR-105]|jgi:opacity protein-like surface antigen
MKMLKTSILSVLAVSAMGASGLAAAQGYTFVNDRSSGSVYVGAEAGWADIGLDTTTQTTVNSVQVVETEESNQMSGFGYRVYGGYRFNINRGFVAFEGAIGQDNAEYMAESNISKRTVESDLGYGGAILFGHELSQVNSSVEIYGLVGYQYLDIEVLDQNAGGAKRSEETLAGPSVGVGLQAGLADNLSIRFQYSRTFFDEETFDGVDQDFDLEPAANRFAIGLIGRF